MIVTAEQVKAHLGITANTDDALLAGYIGQIGDYLRRKIGRAIEQEEITEYHDGDNIKDEIYLGNYPVTELTSLKYRSGSFASPTWIDYPTTDYLLSANDGTIQVNSVFSGLKNIEVKYKAGYATDAIPNALQLAAIKLVSKVYNKRRSDGFSSEEVAGARVDWDTFLSKDIEELINPFRKLKI